MKTVRRRLDIGPWKFFIHQWFGTISICLLAVFTFLCGWGGFTKQYEETIELQEKSQPVGDQRTLERDWSIPLYKTVQLFLLNSGAEDDADHPGNWYLTIARLSSAVLFVALSFAVIRRFLGDVRNLPVHLRRKDHVVICGLGQIGLQILDDLHRMNRSRDVIIVEANAANPWLEYARNLGASIVIGDATKAGSLTEAKAIHASEVFVVNGDDGINLEVTAEIGQLLSNVQRDEPLQLYIHIVDVHLATTLRPYSTILHDSKNMEAHLFNVPRTAAARLVTNQLWPHAPKNDDEVAHYVILGFGAMAQTLAVQLAQLAHFPNRKRSRFTIADQNILASASSFLSRFCRFTSWSQDKLGVSSFSSVADRWSSNNLPMPEMLRMPGEEAIQYACNAEFIDLPAGRSDEQFAIHLAQLFKDSNVKPVLFVCGQQDRENFEAAVQIKEQLANFGQHGIPIFVWLPRQPALAETLTRDGRFFPFGECKTAASYEEITSPMRERLGELIHVHYEQLAAARDSKHIPESWSKSRDDFRESNRVASDHTIIKLASVNHRLAAGVASRANTEKLLLPDSADELKLAEMEHNRWVAERLLAGWRYCPLPRNKNEESALKKQRLNHSIRPWDLLTQEEKNKDIVQVRLVLHVSQNEIGVEKL